MHSTTSLLVLVLAVTACGQTVANDGTDHQGSSAGSSPSPSAASGGSNDFSPGGSDNPATAEGGSISVGGAAGGGGTAGSNYGGSGGDTMVPAGPYAPRSGKFKMVIYSKTTGFRTLDAIEAGALMLSEIAAEMGLDPPLVTEENTFLDDIDAYELVFFMNPSGAIFNDAEKVKFEAWMKQGGAFCGTNSATDVERNWPFYQEVIGQNYETLAPGGTNSLVLEASALGHPALVGLPNPWKFTDVWRNFTSYEQWSSKEGFSILARRASDQQPIIWMREHDNFRSFYTGIGWIPDVFRDPDVKTHLTGAIMWTVRREHCLALPKPSTCP